MYMKNIVLLLPAGVVDKVVDALMVKVVDTDNHGGLHHAVMQAYRNDGDPCLLGLIGMELLQVAVDCPQKTLRPRRTTSVCSHFMMKEDGPLCFDLDSLPLWNSMLLLMNLPII